jgi:hypothetical protein
MRDLDAQRARQLSLVVVLAVLLWRVVVFLLARP